jgi:hypothetical protein
VLPADAEAQPLGMAGFAQAVGDGRSQLRVAIGRNGDKDQASFTGRGIYLDSPGTNDSLARSRRFGVKLVLRCEGWMDGEQGSNSEERMATRLSEREPRG